MSLDLNFVKNFKNLSIEINNFEDQANYEILKTKILTKIDEYTKGKEKNISYVYYVLVKEDEKKLIFLIEFYTDSLSKRSN